jgi:hypothetical protein
MYLFNLDYDKFWKESPAAADIFEYKRNNPNVNDMPYGFDHGGVSDDRNSTWAVFSCVSLSGMGKDVLTISVSMKNGEVDKISHNIKKA